MTPDARWLSLAEKPRHRAAMLISVQWVAKSAVHGLSVGALLLDETVSDEQSGGGNLTLFGRRVSADSLGTFALRAFGMLGAKPTPMKMRSSRLRRLPCWSTRLAETTIW